MNTESQDITKFKFALYVEERQDYLFLDEKGLNAIMKQYWPMEFLKNVFVFHAAKWAMMDMDETKDKHEDRKILFKQVESCYKYLFNELRKNKISKKRIKSEYQAIVKKNFNEQAKKNTSISNSERINKQIVDNNKLRYLTNKVQ